MTLKLLTIKFIAIISICFFNEGHALNILGVFPVPAKSHFFVFGPYLKELANRGHNVTVISFYPQKDPVPNYHDINLRENSQLIEISHPISKSLMVTFLSLTLLPILGGPLSCRTMLEDENVQSLWEKKEKFDLVIAEQFNSDCALGLAYVLGAPVIGISSHMLLPTHYKRFGIPYNPSYVMFDLFEAGSKPTFLQRIKKSVLYNYMNFIYNYVTQSFEQNIIREFFEDVPPLNELANEIKLVLVYQNFVLSGSSIQPANVVDVGGYHVAQPKPLPEDLKKFIDESKHGVIYISFGTILKASSLSEDKILDIIGALAELPQRVIWKWNKKTLPGKPKNIFVSKWLPQNDILAHPNVVAFYSHCGLLGTTEAMYHGVPIVGMPIYGDQPSNAAAIEESGLGVQMELDLLAKDYLLRKLKTVLDPAFRARVKMLSKAWHDRPIKAMDSAIFWTEFAARNKNITLRTPAADVPLYQYLCLDVYSVLLLFVLICIMILKYTISFLIFIIKKNLVSSHHDHKKKKKTN